MTINIIKKIILLTGAIFLFIFIQAGKLLAFDTKTLAQCLSFNQFIMYGTQVCSACSAQKDLFGEDFTYISYIDCNQNQKLCIDKKITGFPTWIDREGNKYSGVIPLEILTELSHCTN